MYIYSNIDGNGNYLNKESNIINMMNYFVLESFLRPVGPVVVRSPADRKVRGSNPTRA